MPHCLGQLSRCIFSWHSLWALNKTEPTNLSLWKLRVHSYLSVRHNSFCYLPHLYVCKVDFTLYVRDLVWLMLFKTALENIGIWNERKVLRQLLNTYLFTSRCIYFARETRTSLLHICYFYIPDLSDLYEAKWISAILLISWIICHGRDGCTLINNKSAFLDV